MTTRYIIEIDFDGDKVYGVREKAEKLTISEARQIISVLEEHKIHLLEQVSDMGRKFNLKDNEEN